VRLVYISQQNPTKKARPTGIIFGLMELILRIKKTADNTKTIINTVKAGVNLRFIITIRNDMDKAEMSASHKSILMNFLNRTFILALSLASFR
jgi:hypothetical protein